MTPCDDRFFSSVLRAFPPSPSPTSSFSVIFLYLFLPAIRRFSPRSLFFSQVRGSSASSLEQRQPENFSLPTPFLARLFYIGLPLRAFVPSLSFVRGLLRENIFCFNTLLYARPFPVA